MCYHLHYLYKVGKNQLDRRANYKYENKVSISQPWILSGNQGKKFGRHKERQFAQCFMPQVNADHKNLSKGNLQQKARKRYY